VSKAKLEKVVKPLSKLDVSWSIRMETPNTDEESEDEAADDVDGNLSQGVTSIVDCSSQAVAGEGTNGATQTAVDMAERR